MLDDMVNRGDVLLLAVGHVLVGLLDDEHPVAEILQVLVDLVHEFLIVGGIDRLRHGIVDQSLFVEQGRYRRGHGGLSGARVARYDETQLHAELQSVGVVVCLHRLGFRDDVAKLGLDSLLVYEAVERTA